LTPRSEASKADFGKPRIEIGYAADQMVDLNRTGPLKVNTEPAFEFAAAHPDGTKKTDVNPDQRWRGKVLRSYNNGEWKPTDAPALAITPLARRAEVWIPPNLGPGQFALEFDVPPRLRGTFVADPVVWVADQAPPLAYLNETGAHAWLPVSDGTFFWDPNTRVRGSPRRYLQVYRPGPDPDAGPPFRFVTLDFDAGLAPLRHNPVARVKDYADRLLTELISTGQLPADCRREDLPAVLLPPPKLIYHDKVARKFAAYLATTPTLRYTTDLKRENTRVDPIEDFLFYSKVGHCERFATALVLMLRSQGIPASFVLGFKGCEHTAEGRYVVKQEHAHAWVEALVPVPGAPVPVGDPRGLTFHWLSLDPTPGATQPDPVGGGGWLTQANTWVETRFQEYVSNYTPEQRQKALAHFVARLLRVQTLAVLAGAVVLVFAVRTARRRLALRAVRPPEIPESARWFGELVALLSAHGISPGPGDTAREFAATAAAALRQRPACAECAEVPIAWADVYYQDRFGGQPPSDARLAELEAGLTALRRALAQ
jgi:transglutaminase-like putative cysteine protease